MPIRVKCESCKKTLSVKDHLAGKKIKCPVCQNVLAVPTASTAPPKEAAPSPSPGKAVPAKPVGTKKPAVVAKPAAKPSADQSKSNGTPPPAADKTKSNGTPDPAPVELPPENIEAAALEAFADEPKPPQEETEPQFIEFKCDWCDEMVKLGVELCGKQAQCPNPECKRIVKVPLLKKAEKKDWKKMDQKGPAGAIVSQPEQLENAWGTEVVSKARQSSLAQADAFEKPAAPPIGFIGWAVRGIKVLVVLAALGGTGYGISRLLATKQQHDAVKESLKLITGKDAKITKDTPLLLAEAHRAIALLYLREGKAPKANEKFIGALSLIDVPDSPDDKKNPAVHEQLALIDLMVAEIEMGGTEDEFIGKTKMKWETAREAIGQALEKIKTPEVRVMALREISTRLIERDQKELALGLAAKLGESSNPKTRPTPFRQEIALRYAIDSTKVKDIAKEPGPVPKEEINLHSHACIGYAEGCARVDEKFVQAMDFAAMPTTSKDRLDAYLGVAAVCLQRKKNDDAAKAFAKAMEIRNAMKAPVSPWVELQIVKLTARLEDPAKASEIAKKLPAPFKLRGQLEVFLAICDKSTGDPPLDALQELEASDTVSGTTLALAWFAVAQRRANRDTTRKLLEERLTFVQLSPPIVDKIRPMVDIGSYLGGVK